MHSGSSVQLIGNNTSNIAQRQHNSVSPCSTPMPIPQKICEDYHDTPNSNHAELPQACKRSPPAKNLVAYLGEELMKPDFTAPDHHILLARQIDSLLEKFNIECVWKGDPKELAQCLNHIFQAVRPVITDAPDLEIAQHTVGGFIAKQYVLVSSNFVVATGSSALVSVALYTLYNKHQIWVTNPLPFDAAFLARLAAMLLRVNQVHQAVIPWLRARHGPNFKRDGVFALIFMSSAVFSVAATAISRFSPFISTLLDYLSDYLLMVGVWVLLDDVPHNRDEPKEATNRHDYSCGLVA